MAPVHQGISANGGERITLKNKNDSLICTFAFNDDPAFWPTAADGAGHSLQVVNPNRMIEDYRNWRASSKLGGSPGSPDTDYQPSALALSEVFIDADGTLAWVEIANTGSASADLASMKFVVPNNSADEPISLEAALSGQVAAGATMTADVNFELVDGDNIHLLLTDADGNVLSAHRFDAENEISFQNFPAGSREWYRSTTASKGTANDPERQDSIVINEIMYDHPAGRSGEFIELYNKGATAVDLSGWEITEGVRFDFPNGTTIAPQEYLVVAADTIWCQENYTEVTPPVGDFEGGLSNDGETIRIVDADGNLVDQVDYGSGGEWPEFADGLGSSMELVHPDMDNNLGSAWRDSDESEKSELREYKVSLKYDSTRVWHPTNDDELHFHLVGEGYVMLKDVDFHRPKSLFNPDSTNLLLNSDKESEQSKSNSGWVFQGTHAFGFYRDGEVHIKATGRGDNRANRVEIDMESLGSSTEAELVFQARWLYGKPRLIAQTADHAWSYEFLIDIPTNLGTPGAPNGSATDTAPPQIGSLNHHPAVPNETEDVTVSARVSSVDGLETVQVAYIDDSEGGNTESLFRQWKRKPMNDEGIDGDAVAGDGIYSMTISDMKVKGRIVVFYVEATSTSGESYQFPVGGNANPALYVVDDRADGFELRTVRAVVSQFDLEAINRGSTSKYDGKFPRSSNQYWNATVIYNESEVYYNAVIRSAGSPFHTGDRANLGLKGKWKMPKSGAWRGRIKTTYDQDPTSGRAHNDRVIRYWLYLLGHKINDNEFIKVAINDSRFNTREEVETPGSGDFLNRVWENGNQGHLYRVDDEWDFGDNLDGQRNSRNAEWNYKSPNGHRPGRYHSEYMLRSRETEYDYTSLIDSFRLLTETDYTQEEAARYFDIPMVALNAAARGYIHDWDFQTLNRGKNTFFYQRPDGLFQYVHWDSDLAFRAGDTSAAFRGGQGSALRNFLRKPWLDRWFKFYLNELVENYSNDSVRFQTWLDLEDNSTKDQGADVNRYISWGERRKAAANREIGDARGAAFVVTTNDGADYSTEDDIVTLTGQAGASIYDVIIQGHPEAKIRWTDTVDYELSGVVLKEGENVLEFRATDTKGNLIGNLFNPNKDSITITKTTPSKPVADFDFSPASLNLSLGQSLDIDASESWDPEGDALTFAFTAPNGAAIATEGAKAKIAFDRPGLYPITIKITDTNGNVREEIREVSVYSGSNSFENYSGRRLASYWQTENIEAQTTRFQPSFYKLGDPDGMLSLSVTADTSKPLRAEGVYPVIHRPLPASEDFSLQTKLVLANLQLGPFQTGVVADITVDGVPHRYAFGLNEGTELTVTDISGGAVTDLASMPYTEGRAIVRIRRMSGQLQFEYRDGNEWNSVHSLALAETATATRGGIFAATNDGVSMRVLFDYTMLVDTGLVSDLQMDLRLTEVMYNPADGQQLEYLEMQNVGMGTLDLNGAHFINGISYTFGEVQLGLGGFLILAKDAAAFAASYDAQGAQVLGGYDGRLSNGGETIELVDANEKLIFSFSYGDGPPWPVEADGQGNSIEVVDPQASVNDSANWQVSAANGSPGVGGAVVEPNPNDTDGDGLPNAWETQYGLNPSDSADASSDLDDDGTSNLGEYLANTDPTSASSYLTLEVTRSAAAATIGFTQQVERRYTVEFTDDLSAGQWQTLQEIAPAAAAAEVTSMDAAVADSAARFYRVRAALP